MSTADELMIEGMRADLQRWAAERRARSKLLESWFWHWWWCHEGRK